MFHYQMLQHRVQNVCRFSVSRFPQRSRWKPRPMLQALGKALGFGGAAGESVACEGCTPESLGCKPPEAGSVTPHGAHLLFKLAAPPGADAAAPDESWWDEKVDGEPALMAANEALVEHKEALDGKKVKVTAFDFVEPGQHPQGAASTHLLVFPGARMYRDLPLPQVASAVLAALAADSRSEAANLPEPEVLDGLTLLVCCHTRRDARCGQLGPPLAARLAALAEQRGLGSDTFRVFKTSHVGGHVYAGNVIVYTAGPRGGAEEQAGSAAAALNGDWFGGVHAGNAEEFLDALLAVKASSGGAGDATLRPFWRGRVGQSKDEQKAYYKAALKDIEDLS